MEGQVLYGRLAGQVGNGHLEYVVADCVGEHRNHRDELGDVEYGRFRILDLRAAFQTQVLVLDASCDRGFVYQIEVFDSHRVQGVGNDFDFQFGDTARYRDVDGCGVGERLVRPYRDFMRGVDVLVGPVERRGRNGGRGQRADLFLVEDTRLERLVGTVDLYGGHLFGGGDDVQIQVVIARQDIEEGVQLSCGRCRPAVEVYQNRL